MLMQAAMVSCFFLFATEQPRYYAHETVEDQSGVIAPYYTGQNGQFDYRARIAAETIKRYPWAAPPKAVMPAPDYVFNGTWNIADDGTITPRDLRDWDTGDLGQRLSYALSALVDYYRYSGDAAAIAHCTYIADYILHHALTPDDHPWPKFPISVPTKGIPYGDCSPEGMMQLDIAAEMGIALLRAYQMTGNTAWRDACFHWADLFAEKRDTTPGMPPWNRYANSEQVHWEDMMTGGIAYILTFLDDVIRLGHTGEGDALIAARDQGEAYLRDVLLPRWTVDDTWGRNYWDWPNPVMCETSTDFAVRYMMEHPQMFPNWRTDVRNILGLFLNRTGVAPGSGGDTYSGAWAFPESSACCGRSLWYAPNQLSVPLAQYAVLANDPWAREIARREQILATYDVHDTGVVEDNIDGGVVVAGGWFKIAHPMMLKHVLGTMAWLPEIQGANRENHIMRSSAVVSNVVYDRGRIAYTTYNALAPAIDVLRLSFGPSVIRADGVPLPRSDELEANGYRLEPLPNGDCIVTIRHDAATELVVEGEDQQSQTEATELAPSSWARGTAEHAGAIVSSDSAHALDLNFSGNQVRLLGDFAPDGGLADVYVDDVKQLVPIDCWNPTVRTRQVLYYRNGLTDGEHRLRIVLRGTGNPISSGADIYIAALQSSSEAGDAGYGSGGGPADVQRMIFGYTGRQDLVDSANNAWRPATEWIIRTGHGTDVVKQAWWTEPRRRHIAGTADPELYRYGVHGPEFWINLTVSPGTYYVRLKFAETRYLDASLALTKPEERAITIAINGETRATDADLAATAGGFNRAVDLVFKDVSPKHGIIEVRLSNTHGGEAILQALEVGQGDGGEGATPVQIKGSKAEP